MVSSWDKLPEAVEGEETEVFCKLPQHGTVRVEPVGRWHKALCHRRVHRHTLSHASIRSSSSSESDSELSEEDEEDEKLLMTLDPKEWKEQDHYAVLGLSKYRVDATDDQIKRAYKKKVLKHHPDKRRARGVKVKEGEDDYFTCITRAWETLGHPAKRRSFDSVDPTFDDSIPQNSNDAKENFYKLFGPVFESNARWSNKRKPPPKLGDVNTPFDEVDDFYAFWYEFDSWREFSYLDEEEKEKGENREERRWIEKQNKAARAKRKKEETARIRTLVDNAYACDPRIAKFKEDAKQKKIQEKEAKKEEARKKKEEEEKKRQSILDEERKAKEKEEEEAKAKAMVAKKEKEAQKKALKKERKTLRTKAQEFEYFASTDDEKVKNMSDVERLAEMLSLVQLQDINKYLTSGDKAKAQEGFQKGLQEVNAKREKEKQELMEAQQKSSCGEARSKGVKSNWGTEETALLIKAVNLFPAGTMQRWEAVASFLAQHCAGSNRSAKEVLAKAKDLQKNDTFLKEDANKKAFDNFSAKMKDAPEVKADGGASQRYMSVGESVLAETGSNPAPWTSEEQKLLEQAIRTYPSSVADRWDKIADCIPMRSKKDCMKRFKELAEMVRAKKLAQLEAQKKAQKKS